MINHPTNVRILFLLIAVSLPGAANAEPVCGEIPRLEASRNALYPCGGELSYDDAIRCTNVLKDEVTSLERREAYREQQVECFCGKLSEVVRSAGLRAIVHYDQFDGACSMTPVG
ncbi:hypothetical protein [Rhizobium sp. SL42]|uniref:hypothetical protein n=1 Tax=Rhizobium sp. SL42 TaxID=2806346 RepID=UPI001F1AF317|nr:hypothetical protein [Rhizobium sp. SL42]UJW75937.1 hypothetical protein IM739_05425 [Rhizobium sp. SL42]